MSGNNLTAGSTAPTYDTSTAKLGTAAMSGGFGKFPVSALGSATSDITIEFWYKTSASGTNVVTGQIQRFWIGLNGGKPCINADNGKQATSAASVSDGNWHHWASVLKYSTGVNTLYIDGLQVATTTYPYFLNSGGYLGLGGFEDGSYPMAGEVDEFAIWQGAKYTANFTPPVSPYGGSETNLILLYHLDSSLTDSCTNATPLPPGLGPLKIGFIGDSITAGTNGNSVQGATALLSGLGYTVTAVNRGISGTSTADWLPANGNGYFSNALGAFTAASVTIVQIMLGTNDARTPNSFTAAQHSANMALIVSALKAAGLQVVIHKPIYTAPYANSTWPADPSTVYKQYFAANMKLVDGSFVFEGDTGAFSYFYHNPTYLADGIHPLNQAQNTILGQYWATALLYKFGNPAGSSHTFF